MKKMLAGLVLVVAAWGFAQGGSTFGDVLTTMAKAAGVSVDGGPAAILARLMDRGIVGKTWANVPLNASISMDDLKLFVADVLNGTSATPASVTAADQVLQSKGVDLSKIDESNPQAVSQALSTVVSSPAVGASIGQVYGQAITPKK